MRKHLVWDWNGTLLNDFSAIVASTNDAVTRLRGQVLSAQEHRDRFYRPSIDFYSELVGRPLRPEEFAELDARFHSSYSRHFRECGLTRDARDAIAAWQGSQSLLSMWFHDQLVGLVDQHGLTTSFSRVDGLRDRGADDSKHPHLVNHLTALGHEPTDCVLIGDTVDDAVAAGSAGAACVLYSGGFTSERKLRETGHPVAATLTEAVELAWRA
ncbi:MAG: HAD family hydrolase [Stackebrandtia sp.]